MHVKSYRHLQVYDSWKELYWNILSILHTLFCFSLPLLSFSAQTQHHHTLQTLATSEPAGGQKGATVIPAAAGISK